MAGWPTGNAVGTEAKSTLSQRLLLPFGGRKGKMSGHAPTLAPQNPKLFYTALIFRCGWHTSSRSAHARRCKGRRQERPLLCRCSARGQPALSHRAAVCCSRRCAYTRVCVLRLGQAGVRRHIFVSGTRSHAACQQASGTPKGEGGGAATTHGARFRALVGFRVSVIDTATIRTRYLK